MTDRTTKVLLVLIVLALWGLLLRPVLTPLPTKAAPDTPAATQAMVVTDRAVYLYHADGNVYLFDPLNLTLKAEAMHHQDLPSGRYTFQTVRP